MENKLVRPLEGGKLAGVCAAFANFLGIDVTLVRLLFVGMLLFMGGGIWVYLICWAFIPKEAQA
jgi:phage shock protein C